jgi:hypothetical protein
MTNKFEVFQQNYDEAIELINKFLQTSKYEPQINGLVQWMLETDANPYSYLPHNWAGSTTSAEAFASLLRMISHAVYDDGDITFVKVDGEPRIVFASEHEDDFRDYVLSEQEKAIEAQWSGKYIIQVLDIKPNEFGAIYDSYYITQVKQWFMDDAETITLERAVEHYEKYKAFDPAWIEQFKTRDDS